MSRTKIFSLSLNFFFLFSSFFSVDAQVNISVSQGIRAGTSIVSDVAYGNGIYVAVGGGGHDGGTFYRSTDGIHFSAEKPIASIYLSGFNKVAFANGLFVAVGDGIVTSSDGITWTRQTYPDTLVDVLSLSNVIYAGGQWIAMGYKEYSYDDEMQYGVVVTSPDGITWTSVDIGDSFYEYPKGLYYMNGKYVIGANNRNLRGNPGNYALYSSTGASGSWTRVLIDSTKYNSLNNLTYLNNTLYALFNNGPILTSTDIINWSADTNPGLSILTFPTGGLYAQGTYYLFGMDSAAKVIVLSSQDGITWMSLSQTMPNLFGNITYVNGFYYLFNEIYTNLAYSTTFGNWTFTDGDYYATATNGNIYATVGQTTSFQDAIFTSPDWSDWTSRTLNNAQPLKAVAYGNGKFVAVGDADTTMSPNCATSTDGLTWTPHFAQIGNLVAIAYGNGRYVAVGPKGEIVYSVDGVNWNAVHTGSSSDLNAIVYANNYFVAVGGNDINNIASVKYSSDGVTWTDVSPNFSGYFLGVTYGAGKYVLIGKARTLDSYNFASMTTMDITDAGAWSAPSTTVTPALNFNVLSGTRAYGGVAYGDGQFLALANLTFGQDTGYVLNSADGLNWTATSTNNRAMLRGIFYDGSNKFKAVGAGSIKLDITTTGSPLPLTLLSFTGRQSGDKNILLWQTSDEINTREFGIEWSADGNTFLPIGVVAAAGNSTANLNYTYTQEPAPEGNDFYRLKLIDIDGHFTYSKVVELSVTGNTAPLSIWPNPVRNETLNISIPSGITLPLAYVLYDGTGKTIWKGQLNQYTQTIDVSGLSKGSYTIWFSNGVVRQWVRL